MRRDRLTKGLQTGLRILAETLAVTRDLVSRSKTFPLRGIKDTPPYLHDGRLLTLDDTVEFFNLILGTRLTPDEKRDLVAFLRAL